MDKNIYETYEFLPANNHETESDQFFVVQNDGTLLINRQVQYVTQVEDVKNVLENAQPCAVYDVSSQQYFVDVDNSTELITVTDQYVLPENSDNVYENNFLLQSIPDTPTVQINEDLGVSDLVQANTELKNEDPDEASAAPASETSNLTEITITDEQYHMLEQKGWVLLNINEKVFLLNALGLHDITGNDRLIQQLKNDIQIYMDVPTPTTESNPVLEEMQMVPIKAKEIEFKAPDNDVQMKSAIQENTSIAPDKIQDPNKEPEKCIFLLPNKKHEKSIKPNLETVKHENDNSSGPKKLKRNCTVVRLKTNYSVEDIPDRIVLGRTKNGKRLVAKIVEIVRPTAPPFSNLKPDHDQNKPPPGSWSVVKDTYDVGWRVEHLIQSTLGGGGAVCAAEDVRGAEAVVRQLLRAPATSHYLVHRNLIITTIVKHMDSSDKLVSESDPVLVTGRVAQFDDARDEWNFIYIPHLLQKLSRDSNQDDNDISITGIPLKKVSNKMRDDYILHVHVVESRYDDAPTKTTISFSKRRPPTMPCITVKKGESVHACSACAMLFQTEDQLKEHQSTQCTVETEDEKRPLIIDVGNYNKSGTKIVKGYKTCPHCNIQVKYANYKRHLKSHFGTTDNDEKNTTSEVKKAKSKPIYKCKMCSTSYLHSSTLSKHIMAQHIKSNVLLVAD